MSETLKIGERVRHQDGWLATVTRLWWSPFEVEVAADDPNLSGTYSPLVFEATGEEEESNDS